MLYSGCFEEDIWGLRMKKIRLFTAAAALLVCASMALAIGGCAKTRATKDDKKEPKQEDAGTAGSTTDADSEDEENEDSDAGKDMKPAVKVSPDAPATYDPLTLEDLHDTWVTENGTYMYYDRAYDCIVDYLGTQYWIEDVQENGTVLSVVYNYYYNDDMIENSPVPGIFFMPMYLVGDELIVGQNHLYRATSEKGQECLDELRDSFVDMELRYTDLDFNDGGFTTFIFRSDNTCMAYDDMDEGTTWEFRNGEIVVKPEGLVEEEFGYIYKIGEDEFLIYTPFPGTMLLYGGDRSDATIFEGDYILYNNANETCYLAEVNGFDGTVETFNHEPVNDLDFTFIDGQYGFTIDVNGEECEPDGTYSALKFITPNDLIYIFRADTIFGQLMLYREDVLNGFIENVFTTDTCRLTVGDITVSVEAEIFDKEEWGTRLPGIKLDEKSTSAQRIIGPVVYIEGDYFGGKITYTIPKSYFNSMDGIAVTVDYFDFDLGAVFIDDFEVTEEGDNYIITFYSDQDHEWYGLMDSTHEVDLISKRDVNTVLTQEVKDSVWANTYNTGDILDMVDLEYVADSIVDENGSADFWVSTPEQLASATYYINELDVDSETVSEVYFYIHLMNDIDLSGYRWASIGNLQMNKHSGKEATYRHQFRGVFYGNGYTIKNLYVVNNGEGGSFLNVSNYSTIIGLTLYDPIYNGYGDDFVYALTSKHTNYTQVVDCKVLVAEYKLDWIKFSNPCPTVNYHDCSFMKIDDDTGVIYDMELGPDYDYESYMTNDNWVEEYYLARRDEDGNYIYDPEGEYALYQERKADFDNGTFYYNEDGQALEAFSSYYDSGFIYNGDYYDYGGSILRDE